MERAVRTVRVRRVRSVLVALVVASLLSGTFASSQPAPGQPASIVDNETVYVVADATGAPQTTVVVDWLQVQGTGTFELSDPAAAAEEIESLTDGFEPVKSGDAVQATVDVDGYADFFYRAETDAALPFEVSFDYYLDGVKTEPQQLAGKTGRLRIDISIVNHLERTETVHYTTAGGTMESSEVTYTVPLLCVPQLEIDGTKMTDIEGPKEAQIAIAGQTLTYAIPMVPVPEAEASIEMDARDIELASTIVSVFPKLAASPDFSVTEEFVDLRDGLMQLGQLSEGHLQVVRGISEGMADYDLSAAAGAAEGFEQLQTALEQMEDGAVGLAQLSAGQYTYLDGVIGGIDTSQFSSIDQLVGAIGQLRAAASQLETGVAGLVSLVDGQIGMVQQMDALNAQALADAQVLAARYPADSEVLGIVGRLTQQDALFDQLLAADAPPGLPFLRVQLEQTAGGLTGLRTGLEQLEAQAGGLTAIPGAFEQLKAALVVLRDGGDPDGGGPAPVMPGLGATRDGLGGLASGLGQAGSGLAQSSADLAMLEQLPAMMDEFQATLSALAEGGALRGQQLPGISTTVQALDDIGSGLGTGVSEMREGEALTEAMGRAADEYTTFMGLPEGATGRLSFLYKVEGVSAE